MAGERTRGEGRASIIQKDRGAQYLVTNIGISYILVTDKATSKRRPALVVSTGTFNDRHGHLVLAMITTAKGSAWPSDVELGGWRTANLAVPCKVRLKLFTLEHSLVVRRLGRLSDADAGAVGKALQQSLAIH